ncbi:MAG: hypothetical protein ABFD20_02490 [Anaerolineales bacterium]
MSQVGLAIFGADTTQYLPCRNGDALMWLEYPSMFDAQPEIVDIWQLHDGEYVLMTNRWEDIPSWFSLHPNEVRGHYLPRMREQINAGQAADEVLDGPNVWRVRAGDRLVWVGSPRPNTISAEGVLGILEARDDLLVLGPERLLTDILTGVPSETLSDETMAALRLGLGGATQLGVPRVMAQGKWGLG